jgi:hypothetical protein
MNAVGGPEVVRAVESEEEEVGEEKERHTTNVHVQQQVPGKYFWSRKCENSYEEKEIFCAVLAPATVVFTIIISGDRPFKSSAMCNVPTLSHLF